MDYLYINDLIVHTTRTIALGQYSMSLSQDLGQQMHMLLSIVLEVASPSKYSLVCLGRMQQECATPRTLPCLACLLDAVE